MHDTSVTDIDTSCGVVHTGVHTSIWTTLCSGGSAKTSLDASAHICTDGVATPTVSCVLMSMQVKPDSI